MSFNEEIIAELVSNFKNSIVDSKVEYDTVIVEIKPEKNIEVLRYLKDTSAHKLDFLTTLCGLHYPQNGGKEIGVMYQLKNLITENSIRLKAFVPIQNPSIQSATSLFPTANWMERQEFDFFGIQFEGHPDLRRILNVDDMDYHPMRKEYRLEDETRDDKEDKYFGR